jgi:hypothetical protein
MKATEFEFHQGSRTYRTYELNGRWRVTMCENVSYFDRDQARILQREGDGFKWSDLPLWRLLYTEEHASEDLTPNESATGSVGVQEVNVPDVDIAEFDSADSARDEVVLLWIVEESQADLYSR